MNGSPDPAQPNEHAAGSRRRQAASPAQLGADRAANVVAREMDPTTILVIGPRELPGTGTVEVWADAGSGGGRGQPITVSVKDLVVSDRDPGKGCSALYALQR